MVQRAARLKTIKRLGPLPGLTRKTPKQQEAVRGRPGGKRPTQKSAYRKRLEEKQKLRYHYGLTETQLRRCFAEARRRRGNTGDLLLSLLERRLDNVVFRLGFAPTMPAARQLVTHGHILVNGRRVDRPALLVDRGQEISIAQKSREIPNVVESVQSGPQVAVPTYLTRGEADPFTGQVTADPRREDVPFPVEEAAIIEFYAR
jgi:small subunit ribosomal protein S4